jgi:hypothetical protein
VARSCSTPRSSRSLASASSGWAATPCRECSTRYESYIKGFGFGPKILWGGVNDIIGDVAGATVANNVQTLVTEMLLEGPVFLVLTPGFGSYAGWSAPREVQLQVMRAQLVAWAASRPSVTIIDLYQPYPVGMNDPDNPTAMLPALRYSDGLHINPDPGATHVRDLVLAKVLPLYPAVPSATITAAAATLYLTQRFVQTALSFLAQGNPESVATSSVQTELTAVIGVQSVSLLLPSTMQSEMTPADLVQLGAGITYLTT